MLILMRHGEAVAGGDSDDTRSLTAQGKARLESLYEQYYDVFKGVERVLCSPYLRARQSADVFIGAECELVVDAGLTPCSDVDQALQALEAHWCDNLLVVTHQPLISRLISYLEYANYHTSQPVRPGDAFQFDMPWPAASCAQRLYPDLVLP
ncbi:MAG: SixA phosphatase family protein [Pseudomonadales bacterium]